MIRKYALPIFAVAGLALGLFMVRATSKPPMKAQPMAEPAKAPFQAYVSGAGLIEASTENVKVGSSSGGLVTRVFVKVGDAVRKGQPLWQLDEGPKRAEIARYQAAVESAAATLEKLRAGNRQEEISKQEQQVAQSKAQLDDARAQLALRETAYKDDTRAISLDEVNQARNAVRQREAATAYQQTELERLKRGTWAPEIRVQQAAVEQARTQVMQAQEELERLTVRSPLNGAVMQVKIHAGEYAPAGQTDDALMLVGNNDDLNIRVDVDEQDAWRVERGQPAAAYPRGRADLKVPPTFVRVEPYVVPKRSLTGASTERVDTRVLQVVYSFRQPETFHLYAGQQMDVYIQAKPLPDPGARQAQSKGPETGGRP
ncbi:efflux RND transporter periplasmic adaptor subunit [uncultured Paludibaculum sp.]|uniref:HlyD family secretion protein n=1 Tax=uncultured Paludibaculum sp. TaxID=1765020 RepID=UPI002AAC47EC|nr:efflux RND transporter periplasmic adaptor subunit [uncultured Paludibaculum sp.]